MVYNNVVVTVKDERDIDEVKSLLLEQTRLSRLEPGCDRFELYHSQSDAKVFILVERWSSAEALDQHRLAKAYVNLQAEGASQSRSDSALVCVAGAVISIVMR